MYGIHDDWAMCLSNIYFERAFKMHLLLFFQSKNLENSRRKRKWLVRLVEKYYAVSFHQRRRFCDEHVFYDIEINRFLAVPLFFAQTKAFWFFSTFSNTQIHTFCP